MSTFFLSTMGLIGCGNMGYAMAQGWINHGFPPADIHIVEPDENNRQRAQTLGAVVYDSMDAFVHLEKPDIIVIAVKPQIVTSVLQQCKKWSGGETLFLSVAAGTTISRMQTTLGEPSPILRVMPNTPAIVGEGMMVCCPNFYVSPNHKDAIEKLLAVVGQVSFINDEKQMDAVTAISGSGPAYLFHFLECLQNAGVSAGLDKDLADKLALQTIYGAAQLVKQSDFKAETLRQQVTSPNGTTAAALDSFMSNNALQKLVDKAVDAAKRRSEELAREH